MSRDRAEFDTATKRAAYERSKGICECHLVWCLPTFGKGCGVALGEGNTFYEHIDPDAISKRNDLANAAVLCKTCWFIKSNQYDKPTIADNNRMRDRARGIKTRQSRPIPGTYASGIRKPFNRKPEWRDSGRPIWK